MIHKKQDFCYKYLLHLNKNVLKVKLFHINFSTRAGKTGTPLSHLAVQFLFSLSLLRIFSFDVSSFFHAAHPKSSSSLFFFFLFVEKGGGRESL